MKKIIKHLKKNWYRYGFETLVVILGVLIAFALNDWNESQKQQTLEIQYLKRLKEDLANDTAYYIRRISASENGIEHHRKFIHQIYQTQKNIEDVRGVWNHAWWDSEHLTTQNSTYIELTNSGNLNIFRNQELKEWLINYYRENERAAVHIKEFNEVSGHHLIQVGNVIPNSGKFYSGNDDLYNNMDIFSEGEWAFMNDPTSKKFQTVEYAITFYKAKHDEFLKHFRTLKAMSAQLINDVQKELDSRM